MCLCESLLDPGEVLTGIQMKISIGFFRGELLRLLNYSYKIRLRKVGFV